MHGEGVLGQELGQVLEQIGAVEAAVVVEIELDGEAGHAQHLQEVVDGHLLLLVGDLGRLGHDDLHELDEEVLHLELEVAAQALEHEKGDAQHAGEERQPLGRQQVVQVLGQVVLEVGEQRLVRGHVVDARLEADGDQIEAHRDHELAVLGVGQRDEKAQQFAHTRQAVRYVGRVHAVRTVLHEAHAARIHEM